MALPSSRNRTYSLGSVVVPEDLNDIQDYTSQAWLASTGAMVFGDGLISSPAITGATAARAVYAHDKGVTVIFSYTAPTAYLNMSVGWGGQGGGGTAAVGSLTNINAMGTACYGGGVAICGIGHSAGSAARILRVPLNVSVNSPSMSSASLTVSGTEAPTVGWDGLRFWAGLSTGASWRSTDGTTWTANAAAPAGAAFSRGVVAFNQNQNTVVLAATGGFAISTDGGVTWATLNTKPVSGVVSVGYDNETRTYWCATTSTVYRGTKADSLTDWAETPWASLQPPIPSGTGATIHCARGAIIAEVAGVSIASVDNGGMWRIMRPTSIDQFTRHGWLGYAGGMTFRCGGVSV